MLLVVIPGYDVWPRRMEVSTLGHVRFVGGEIVSASGPMLIDPDIGVEAVVGVAMRFSIYVIMMV